MRIACEDEEDSEREGDRSASSERDETRRRRRREKGRKGELTSVVPNRQRRSRKRREEICSGQLSQYPQPPGSHIPAKNSEETEVLTTHPPPLHPLPLPPTKLLQPRQIRQPHTPQEPTPTTLLLSLFPLSLPLTYRPNTPRELCTRLERGFRVEQDPCACEGELVEGCDGRTEGCD